MKSEIESIIKSIQTNFSITDKEIEEILEYNSYIEPEKEEETRNSLIINSLQIKGKHNENELINKTFKFQAGVNVISTYGYNLKGKTTILDIIKYTLTGKESSLPNFIKGKINEYKLYLEVNNKKYLFYFNNLNKIFWIEDIDENIKIKESELKNASDILADFFEKKFNYYSLKSYRRSKKSIGLTETELNWNSYFSSLYLEAKKYNFLITETNYSGLKNKILQILFNFQYNKYLNQIKNKIDKVQNSILLYENLMEYKKEYFNNEEDENINNLVRKQSKNNEKIRAIKEKIENIINYDYNTLFIKQNEQMEYSEKKNFLKMKQKELTAKLKKLKKKELDLKESKVILKYFPENFLCPICLKEISDSKKKDAISKDKCYICGQPHEYVKDEKKEFNELNKIKLGIEELEKELPLCYNEIENVDNILTSLKKEIRKLEKEKSNNKIKLEEDSKELKELEILGYELKTKIAVLKTLEDLNSDKKLKKELEILEAFSKKLEEHIMKSNKNKLDTFIHKFLEESKKIGSTSIDNIRLKNSLDFSFTKGNIEESFERLSTGEQLRIKISFYLAWLQLTLEEKENVIHPAFLMIDSPGKEETNTKDLDELSNIFSELDKKGGEFQIIIASAKDLDNATNTTKIQKFKGYLF